MALQWLDRFSLDSVALVSKYCQATIAKRGSLLPLRVIKSVTVSRVDAGYWTLVEGRCSPSRFVQFDSESAAEALREVFRLCNDGAVECLRITGHRSGFELDNEASLILQKILATLTVKKATFQNVLDADDTLQALTNMAKGLESVDLAWRTVRVTDAFLNCLLQKDVAEVRIADADALTDDAILRFCLGSSAVSSNTGGRAMDLNCPGISEMFFHKLIQTFFEDSSATPIALMISTDGCFDLTPYALLTPAYCIDCGQRLRAVFTHASCKSQRMRYVFDAAKNPFELRVDGDRYELYRNCTSHPMSEIKLRKRKRTVMSR